MYLFFDRLLKGVNRRLGYLYWTRINAGNSIQYLYKKSKRVFDDLPIAFKNNTYSGSIGLDSKKCSLQEEYVVEINDVFVEPSRGLGIVGINKVVDQTALWPGPQLPYVIPYITNRWNAKKIKQAIAYDAYVSQNYYHHLLNGVNSIHMLEKVDLPNNIPFLVSRRVFEHKYFQYLYRRSDKFRGLNWLVQEPDEWYKVEKLYRLQCVHFDKEPWLKTRQLYNLPPRKCFRKVFLSRDAKRFGRGLANEEEVSRMLASYGFETVYAENLTMEEQTELFQTTKYLVALHGAGLVQELFMDHENAHIIEVMPQDYMPSFYYWLAYTLGVKYYDVVIGGGLNKENCYHLDLAVLQEAVDKMLFFESEYKMYGNFLMKSPLKNDGLFPK